MLFRLSLIAALVFGDAAAKVINEANGSIRANSKMGQKLMSKARKLEQGDVDVDDIGWMVNYDIKFMSCHAMTQYGEEGGGEESNLYTQRIVKYTLCPSGTCADNCAKGGQYVVGMMDFVQVYNEYVQESQEFACQEVAENCNCENANDDEACEAECYEEAGLSYCVNADEAFEVDRYLECAELEAGEAADDENYYGQLNYNYRTENSDCPNNQNNRAQYVNEDGELEFFAGMYCDSERGGDGKNIYLGAFLDETCSNAAPEITYKCLNYGIEMPFSASTGDSIVQDDCISCKQVNDADDDGGDPEIAQICEEPYEMAGKCETGMEGPYWLRERECEFIGKVESIFTDNASKSGGSAVAWAWFFAICSLVVAGFAYTLYQKVQRKDVSLAA